MKKVRFQVRTVYAQEISIRASDCRNEPVEGVGGFFFDYLTIEEARAVKKANPQASEIVRITTETIT